MANKTLRRSVAVVLSTAMVAVTASCSLFGGGGAGAKPVLEKTTLRVGFLPLVDVAPLFMAKEDGKFSAIGLNVDTISMNSEKDAMTALNNGTIDIAFASHVTFFKAAAEGTELQLQGEAYQAGTNTMALVTLKNSTFTALNRGNSRPTIGVDSTDSIGALTTKTVFKAAGVNEVKLEQVEFGKMESALLTGKVEAAWMVEPHLTRVQKQIGAVVLSDTARGGTLDFPMSGYAATRRAAEESPKTFAAFRQVLSEAQLLGTNHLKVQEVLIKYATLDPQTAALVAVGTFPVSINPVRLQRVADMMESNKLLNTRLDVLQLLPPSAPVN
ncbi:ABC transporter substrate-binding protein [Crossiella sp. NPDC003009]